MQGSAGLEEDGTLMARPWNPRDVPVRNGPGSGRLFAPSTSLDEHSNGGRGEGGLHLGTTWRPIEAIAYYASHEI